MYHPVLLDRVEVVDSVKDLDVIVSTDLKFNRYYKLNTSAARAHQLSVLLVIYKVFSLQRYSHFIDSLHDICTTSCGESCLCCLVAA